ncbi:MAG: two-component regulator propeller domain-containing protein [Paludibacter sp.]|nr:two-component regulator propeller domain-containing protein [Paludibacter sp.]
MNKLRIKIFFLLYVFPVLLYAQIGTFYSTDNELSSSLINTIYQDNHNYIWIATEDGLNKFDGIRFTIYKNQPGDTTTIRNNYVRSLFEDSKGRFWIGCINALHLYDRATDHFREIPLYLGGSIVKTHITSIIESNQGELWMTTSGVGVVRMNENESVCRVDESLSRRLSSLHLTNLYQDSRGNFWIASENQGLNLYDPKTNEITVFRSPQGIGSNQISAICEDIDGNIFVSTLTDGVYRLNPKKRKFELIPHINNAILSVKTLLIDNKNRLLIGTDGQGMKIYNPQKNILEDYQMQSAPFDFSRMKVHAICQDRMGNIWTGLFQKGVYLDPESPNKFNYLGHKSFNRNTIGSGCVMSLYKDKEGYLWIGTDNDGVYRIDRNGQSTHYKPGNQKDAVPNTVLSIIEDDEGNIWLGSYLKGLAMLDKRSGKCTYFDHYEFVTGDDNTARNKIFSLAKDNKKKLWIGTSGAGVYVFDLEKRKYVNHYSQTLSGKYHIPNDWINYLMYDNQGVIWIGSYIGILTLNPASGEKKHYTTDYSVLPGNVVYHITQTNNGEIWIGTTEGMARFDRKTNASQHFTTENGLPSNVICGILEDEDGNKWISTHSGISKYNVRENKFINYFAFDGLQGNEFSLAAAHKSKKGEMFFGGINGVTSFLPSEINVQRVPTELHITALYLMDKKVFSGGKSHRHTVFNGFIADVDTFRLSHRDNMFALEFSTFDFGFSERVHYQYMLEGLNSQWMSTEPGINRINFTNLSYGTYTLRVKAVIYDSSSEERKFTLIIFPPWYLTWWAKVIYFILISLLLLGIARFITDKIRHRNELMRREHIEQISEAKLQFFINISHEIRTPMTLIMSPLEKLISENENPEKRKVYLLIYRNAQRILRLINQLMDVRKLDKGQMTVSYKETDMVGFIDDIIQTFEYQAKKNNLHLSFIHADRQLKAWIDQNNFDKILVNILSNAFKFTPEDGEINVILRTGVDKQNEGNLKDFFEIIVSDTGIGIQENKIEKIFERFYQINTNEHSAFGTGIGLHLARSLVELQHGTLFARNRTDCRGSEFIIRMPLGNKHIKQFEFETDGDLIIHKEKTESPVISDMDINDESEKIKIKSKTAYKILIVEDEDDIRHYLVEELSDTYKIAVAVNGKDALQYILREKPNLVISDVMMPEMDGFTLTKKIKSNININHIPIILLTARASDEDKVAGLESGADAYISKPFNIDLLKVRVANLLENRERLEHKTVDNEGNKVLIKPVVLRSSDQILYEKIIKIINENISDPDLNVEFLANGVGMSRVHMHRKLKELTNQSARDFIRSIRLKQAADLLSSQKLTVSEVVYALGFTNLSHFSTSFREFYGMSPKEYAEKNRKNDSNTLNNL